VQYPQGDSNPLHVSLNVISEKELAATPPKRLAHSLAHKKQNLAQSEAEIAQDYACGLAAAAAALAKLPQGERCAGLDALADALRSLPIGERARLAARLLEGG
jgi:hypothetical protein